ncbi:hypothetical protein WR25_00739 [Diploscapter pachys]|uniref:C2 domain-containing protein n=1 Tax=Diploscapter pachys TaxID=2018661 RepID=A0A2A2LER1_9BILA|nr:hypothetical protein WR25_00739 [Diploscapter pachys]
MNLYSTLSESNRKISLFRPLNCEKMPYGHHNGYPPPFGPPQVGHIGNTLGLHRYGNMQEFCIDSAPSSPPLPVLPSPIHQQPFNYNPLPMPAQMPIQSRPNDFPFEDDDEPDYSTEFDYDSDIDDNSNSMPQRTHSNPQFYRQSSDDERRYTRSKMPPCGISARFLRTNDSSSFTYNTIGSSSLELSTDTNEENLGGMYASIDKERRYRERLRSPILAPIPNRDLSMIEAKLSPTFSNTDSDSSPILTNYKHLGYETQNSPTTAIEFGSFETPQSFDGFDSEGYAIIDSNPIYDNISLRPLLSKSNRYARNLEISPVRNCASPSSDDGYSGPPAPSPRFPKHWNPQLTSTSTSLKPIQPLLPKTNPYQEYNMRSANIVSSTPKTSERRRIPKFSSNAPQYQKNFERPRSYYADVDDDLNYMEPPTNTLSSVRSWTTEFKPEAYGLPSGVAKYFGVTGILFLTISYCTATRRIEVTVKNAVFFRDASQTQVCSYVRDRYNASRVEQTHRTKLAYTTNKPEYKERFVFPISHDCRKDSLLVSVYAMNADNVQTQRLMGCMAFPLERMFKKLKNLDVDYYYRDGPENAPKFELYSDGFFILSRERGLKNHLGSKKVGFLSKLTK